jgi:diacylglycerol kinase family enzyme
MNPHSGGGKVARYRLIDRAEALGARVVLLDGAEQVDVVALAREAVAQGADLLGVAGGDGTQALVAGVAADAGIPFLVIRPAPATISRLTSAWTVTIRHVAWTR